LNDIIAMQNAQVVALFDSTSTTPAILNVPLYKGIEGYREWCSLQSDMTNFSGIVAIGGSRGRDRLIIQQIFSEDGISVDKILHPTSYVSPTARLGSGTQVLAHTNIASDVITGMGCIVNNLSNIDHECILGNGVHIAPGAVLCGCVRIDDYAFIGAGAVVLPRINIGRDSVVGAGAIVTKDVPAGVTVVGNPARILKRSR
jgi:sugar O-acyltransferase (sialic acid O-acetyltransferase NeuD family)